VAFKLLVTGGMVNKNGFNRLRIMLVALILFESARDIARHSDFDHSRGVSDYVDPAGNVFLSVDGFASCKQPFKWNEETVE
jgi:hypothetical protein